MRAKTVNFQKGPSPKRSMDIGISPFKTEEIYIAGVKIEDDKWLDDFLKKDLPLFINSIENSNGGDVISFKENSEDETQMMLYSIFRQGYDGIYYRGKYYPFKPKTFESLEFERGQDPKKSLQVGLTNLIPKIIEKFEEFPFELIRRGMVLDLNQEYELSSENFHNPAGYPEYDWDDFGDIDEFIVSILYMIDLDNQEISRKMNVSNPDIEEEYNDNERWKIKSLDPQKIFDEIDQDYALIDIADAAEYLWDAYQHQQEEIDDEEWEEEIDDEEWEEEIDESVNFEKGIDPKKAMAIGDAAIYKKIEGMMKADGWTPSDPYESDSAIAWAVEYKNPEIAKFLLDRHGIKGKKDIEVEKYMADYIQWAAQNKDLEMVELLLSYEPDPTKLDFALRMASAYEPAYNAIKKYVNNYTKEIVNENIRFEGGKDPK